MKYFVKRYPKIVYNTKVIQVILDFIELSENKANSVLRYSYNNSIKEQYT